MKNLFSLRSFSVRIFLVVSFFVLAINLLAFRYFSLQVSKHAEWKEKALAQQINVAEFGPERGEILTRDKNGNLQPLAVNKHVYHAVFSSRDFEGSEAERKKLASVLSEVLSLSSGEVLAKISKSEDAYEILKKNISEETAKKLKTLGVKGLWVEDEESRFYPLKEFASHLIGFVGFNDADEISGRYGLELGLDGALSGSGPDRQSLEKLLSKSSFLGVAGIYRKDGSDIVLTIEPIVQQEVEKLLAEEVEKWNARSGNAIVINPKTGEIVALANYPDFDPNLYSKEKDLSVFLNSAVSLRYEPGSVFKPFTMAAGLSSGKIFPNTEYYDSGEKKINGRVIRNAGDSSPKKMISMSLFLERSYNLGAVFIQETVGDSFFRDFVSKQLGFVEKTGIDLPQEIQSSFANLYPPEGRSINFATASFGQGVAVTPIKLLQEFSAFGNGGLMMRPFVVSEIRDKNGKVVTTKPELVKRTMSKEVVDQTLPLLENVVSAERGSGKLAKINGYRIAGKTGTGEIPDENGKGYSERVNHSFLGLGPVSDPKFVILTRIEDPKGVRYAEATAAPLFRKIMSFILNYYMVPPDKLQESGS